MRIPYSKQYIDYSDILGVKKVLKSKYLTQGPIVKNFEKKISEYVKSKYAIAVSNASAGLHISCLALGLKKKDIMWTVPNTFVATANCGLHCGANIDFVDIDNETNNISLEKLKIKLEISKKKRKLPKIIIPVHFSGQPTLQDEIYKLSKKYKFKIIEDASHSLGAKYKNNFVGNCKWSNLTVFSFHPVKPITTAEGGIITTNSKKLYMKLIKLRENGITKNINEFKVNNKNKWYYEQQDLGFNYRMNEIQASLGITQLKKLDKINIYRNKIAKIYNKKFVNLPLDLPNINSDARSTFHLYVLKLRLKNLKSYSRIFNYILSKGLDINLHYLPVHLHPLYKKYGFKKGDFPISESYAKRAISIPLFYKMKKIELKKVISIIVTTINHFKSEFK